MMFARLSRKRGGALLAALLATLAAATSALAGPPSTPAPPAAQTGMNPEITIEAVPVFGTGASIAWGWNEILVRIQNNGTKPARGTVNVRVEQFSGDRRSFQASAPFNVGAGASVHVRLPAHVDTYGDVNVDVTSEAGEPIASTHFSAFQPSGVLLVDVSVTSRLRGAINEASISPLFTPSSVSSRGSTPPRLIVEAPRFDPATSDPILPDRAALYASADAVLIRSDKLTHLTGAELDALAGYVLSGGTLALVVSRPEDIRHPTLISFAGGSITKTGVSSATLAELSLPSVGSFSMSAPGKTIPPARNAIPEVSESLAGYSGGNLHGSLYGNSAFYGLGEVHFLAFDPTDKPAVNDPWAQSRMVDLARRAYDRRSTQVFRPGSDVLGPNYARVRQQLDPNQSSRWAIGVAALLLCIYAVLAGPLNFSLAAKKGKPLRALRHLPIFATITFALVVGIGMAAKGVTGRARHLTMIEAGGGMSKGSARRFRGFFASRAKDLTVRTTDGSSIVSTAVLAESAERRDHLIVDRDGARLVDVAALPWQTVVIREDGFGSLGEGIAIVREDDSSVAVINRSGRDLRAVLLRLPDGTTFYAPRLKDGDKLSSTGATPVLSMPDGSFWLSQVNSSVSRAGSVPLHRLVGAGLAPLLEQDAPGLGAAWLALEDAAGDSVDWFPDDTPVLLGQIDGGEGRSSDSGLRLESDRLLVRIVGFGGNP
jgi:hypothetical protein